MDEYYGYFRYLNMSLSGTSGVRKQDGRSIITNIASNIYGRDLAFDYVRNSWDRVLELYVMLLLHQPELSEFLNNSFHHF